LIPKTAVLRAPASRADLEHPACLKWQAARHNLDMSHLDGPAARYAPAEAPSACIRVVVMGVAGCGKSAVGQLIAAKLGLPLIEGDDFHPAINVSKMQRGVALTDEDRADWLATLGLALAQHGDGAVLTCSALKAGYRDRLRAAATPLQFVYLQISEAESLRRVGQRAGHFYPPSLVASQFAALQDPSAEPGVLTLDGSAPLIDLGQRAAQWLTTPSRPLQ
jgi:gluconokinase